ncbi:MAG: hypothetical protein AAGJ52_13450 [Pseudomonadota bacterium]
MRIAAPMLCRVLALTTLLVASGMAYAQTFGLAVNSRGNEIDSQRVDALWRINMETGEAEYIGWTSFLDLEGLAFTSDGELLGADDDTKTLVRVSQTSGLAIPVGGQLNRNNLGVSLSENFDFGMALDCEDLAYVVSSSQQTLYQVDLDSGEIVPIGGMGALGAPISDLTVRGTEAFGIGVGLDANGAAFAPNLYAIDLETGESSLIGPLGDAALPYNSAGLDFDADGVLWAVTDRRAVPGGDFPSAILQIDPETGQASLLAETIVGLESLAIGPATGCGLSGSAAAIAVPVLSWESLMALMLVLLALGALQVRLRAA